MNYMYSHILKCCSAKQPSDSVQPFKAACAVLLQAQQWEELRQPRLPNERLQQAHPSRLQCAV